MKKDRHCSGPETAAKMFRGLFPLVLLLAVSATVSGCASYPWDNWDLGWGEGKWATSVGQKPPARQEPPETQAPQDSGDSARKAVVGVQTRLAELGYKPGAADGIMGPTTAKAIRHYQKDAGLNADGKVSETLVARLRQPPPPRTEIVRPATPRTIDTEPPRTADTEPPRTADAEPPRESGPETLVIGYARSGLKPDYSAGDVYAWSDGAIERVLRTRGDTIWWSRNDGAQYSTPRSFILPMLQWKTPLGSGRTVVGMDSAGAWPHADGTALSFTVHESGDSDDDAARAQNWTCRSTERGRTTVPAGTFRTVTIACERTGAAPDAWHKRIWRYAPAVRHYVRRDDFIGASQKPLRVELIAMRLGAVDWPPAVRVGLDQAIQKSLENKVIGEQTRWKSTAVDHSFMIQPTGEAERSGWLRCRTYVVERMTPKTPRAWPGLACRGVESDRWLVPILDEENGPLATITVN